MAKVLCFLLPALLLASPAASSALSLPDFAVEPSNVLTLDEAKSAVFTCLLAQPTSAPLQLTGSTAAIAWYYNGRPVNSVTDKIRIPLANGSLYVSAAAIEVPRPSSVLADVPLPTSRGYNCRATMQVTHDGTDYNATIVSRVAHVLKKQRRHSDSRGSARPQRLHVRTGDVAVLVCGGEAASTLSSNGSTSIEVSSDDDDKFVWFRDDEPLLQESDSQLPRLISVVGDGRMLEFAGISADDFGEYTCVRLATSSIVNRFILVQSTAQRSYFENMEPTLHFLVKPGDQTVAAETADALPPSLILFCSPTGYAGGMVTTMWLKDGATVASSENPTTVSPSQPHPKHSVVGRGSLLISRLGANDSGIYTCRSSLSVAETTLFIDANVNVDVAPAPTLCSQVATGDAVMAPATGSIDLDCGVQGASNLYWFHNGNYLPPDDDASEATSRRFFYAYSPSPTAPCGGPLKLWAVTDSDAGLYQCFGANEAGIVSSRTFLVTDRSSSLYVFNSTDHKIDVFASPAATVLQDEDRSKRPAHIRTLSNSETTLHMSWDAPLLSQGTTISGYVVLVKSLAPLIKVDAPPDDANKLRRLFAPNPEVMITRLAPGRKYEVTVATVFKAVGHTSLSVGAMSHPVFVGTSQAAHPPLPTADEDNLWLEAPTHVRAEVRSPSAVNVAWAAPKARYYHHQRSGTSTRSLGGINRYRLFYRSGSGEPGSRNSQQDAYVDLPGHKTSHVLASLEPNTPYTFYVRAGMNNERSDRSATEAAEIVLGPASRDVTIWTPSTAPTGSPQNVEAAAGGPSLISVRWQPPHTNVQNGLVTGYKVVYQRRGHSPQQQQQQKQPFSGRTVLTDGITTMVALRDGVAPNAEYEVRVAAINVNGTGPLSPGVFVTTPEQQLTEASTPGAPFAFSARAPSPSQIVLSWQPPSSASSVLVRGYYLSYGVGEPYRNQVMVDASKTEHILTNLRPSSEYIVSLRSYNNYGYGPEVFQAVRTPQLDGLVRAENAEEGGGRGRKAEGRKHKHGKFSTPLSTPLGVKAFTLSDSAVLVSWTDPNEHTYHRNNVVMYTVRYRPMAEQPDEEHFAQHLVSTPVRWHVVNSTLPSVRIHSLEPWQRYEFAVRIVRSNAAGHHQISDWSMSAMNRTMEAPPGDAPRDVQVTKVPASGRGPAVRVSWQPPLKPNGVVTSYVVFYCDRMSSGNDRDWQVIGVGGDRYSVLIRRLQPTTTYHFKVQAKNSRGYGPASMPPVHIHTPAKHHSKDSARNPVGFAVPGSNRHPMSHKAEADGGESVDSAWPFDSDFFGNRMVQRVLSSGAPLGTTPQSYSSDVQEADSGGIANPTANTWWLVTSAGVGALVVGAIACVAVFVCRKLSSPRGSGKSKLMGKSDSLGVRKKMSPGDASAAANGDMWTRRDHLELHQQLMSAEVANSGPMSVMAVSEENLLTAEQRGSSSRHRPSQEQQASMRSHQMYLDPYENETIIIGTEEQRQTSSAMMCSPTGGHPGTMSYRHQHQVAAANARLFTSRASTSNAMACQESYPLLTNGHHTYRQGDEGDDFDAGAMSTARMGSVVSYQQHRGSPAALMPGVITEHMLSRQQQLASHQTLPRLSIATMASPGPAPMHRYEPLLTTTNGNGSAHMFACPPPAQTPDSGCDIEHSLHHQLQQRQRASLSSSSYGAGSVSSTTTNNMASFRHQCADSPSVASTSASSERPRLSSFQPLQSSANATPLGCNNKTSFLHLSRVLPPTPGQVRAAMAASSATISSSSTSHQPERTSSVTLSSSSQANSNSSAPSEIASASTGLGPGVGSIALPPAPPDLSTATVEDDLAVVAEMSCLDGLMKDLKLNVATSSSVTLTNGSNGSNAVLSATSKVVSAHQ